MNSQRGWTFVIASIGVNVVAVGLIVVMSIMAAGAAASGDDTPAGGALALLIAAYGLVVVGFGIFVAWFATQNRDMNQITGGRFNTTLWTLLLFVPIASIVSLYKYADHIHTAQTMRGVTGMNPVVMFLLMWLISLVGWPIAQAQMSKLG